MMIERRDIEAIVRTMIDERLADLADTMNSRAYYERDRGGILESKAGEIYSEIEAALKSNIEDAQP